MSQTDFVPYTACANENRSQSASNYLEGPNFPL